MHTRSKQLPTSFCGVLPIVLLQLLLPAAAQVKTNVPAVVPGAGPVTAEHIKIHGLALEGNLEGNAVDREVIVFLPPGYASDKTRRYSVVYVMHGYSIGAEQWTKEIHVPQTIEGAFAQGAQEMIIVLPIRRQCTTARCTRVLGRQETLSDLSRRMS